MHRSRHVHGDHKSDNVLVDTLGSCKLIDFGLTKRLAAESSDVAVSKHYVPFMDPEPYSQPGQVLISPHTDVYAALLVAAEMATGRTVVAFETEEAKAAGQTADMEYWFLMKREYVLCGLVVYFVAVQLVVHDDGTVL